MKTYFNIAISAAATTISAVVGDWDTSLAVLAVFMTIDYITGVLCGIATHSLSSEIGFKGLFKKFVIICVVIVGAMLDRLTGTGSWAFRTIVTYFYVANEGVSIIENASRLGLPIPKKIVSILDQLKEEDDK